MKKSLRHHLLVSGRESTLQKHCSLTVSLSGHLCFQLLTEKGFQTPPALASRVTK